MPVFPDHPLRLARIRRNLSSKELAVRAGLHRSTVQAIEEGRTREPDFDTLQAIGGVLSTDAEQLGELIEEWAVRQDDRLPELGARARMILDFTPAEVAAMASFAVWRNGIAPSVTGFASLLGINRRVVADYEAGSKKRGMPLGLSNAIVQRLGASDEYLLAVQALKTGEAK